MIRHISTRISRSLLRSYSPHQFPPAFPLLCMSKHSSSSVSTAAAAVPTLSTSPSPSSSSSNHPPKRPRLSSPHIPTPTCPLSTTPPLTMPLINPTITPTPEESTLRQLLVDCAAHIEKEGLSTAPVILRFTGGWVRDKLLQIPSHDIDVGINTMTGYDFAVHLSEFIRTHGTDYNIYTEPHGIYKIQSNPLKSKHLETATTRIFGLDIDLVNLRSEAYSEDSRIPVTMAFGTPTEDALRRDATVNALFYNLHTGEVEDFTGRGLTHLKEGIIDTPLLPFETFKDDPLRVLRLLRFASRFNFTILPPVREAMRDPEIHGHLATKISRERVAVEVEKMLKGRDPYRSLSLIHKHSLTSAIFCPPTADPPEIPWADILPAINALNYILTKTTTTNSPEFELLTKSFTEHDKYMSWIMAATVPWRNIYNDIGKKTIPAGATAVREGLKLRNKDYDLVADTYNHIADIQSTVSLATSPPDGIPVTRSTLGSAIRSWGTTWQNQLLHAAIIELIPVWNRDQDSTLEGEKEPSEAAKEILKKYTQFAELIYLHALHSAWEFKPLINGKELGKILGRKNGTWMKDALEKVVMWQMDNPEGTREELGEWVKERGGREEI